MEKQLENNLQRVYDLVSKAQEETTEDSTKVILSEAIGIIWAILPEDE